MYVLLDQKNKTQYGIEKSMAMSRRTIQTIMKAKDSSANVKTIFQLCKGLGVEVWEFFNYPIFMGEEIEID